MEINQNIRNPKEPNTGVKVIVLIALIVLLIVGILLPIKLVPNAVTSVTDYFSSLFGGGTVTLGVDKNELRSGESFTLSWNGKTRENGSYMLSYPCIDGVRLETSVHEPYERITCDSQFYFSPTNNAIELTAVSENSHVVDIPVTLSFMDNNATGTQKLGEMVLTVINPNIAEDLTPTNTPTPQVTKSPRPSPSPVVTPKPVTGTPHRIYRASNPYGQADLAVQILAVGYLNPKTNAFVRSNTLTNGMRAAVKFMVINNGDKNTGAWNFSATLPSRTNPTYTAINRPNLGPGDSVEYVLGFENLNNNAQNTVTITADPQNYIFESNENNNTYSATIINAQNSNYNNGNYNVDLAVRIVSTNADYNRASIRFEVQNVGNTTSGSYRFRVTLPSSSNPEYVSSYQNSLTAGARTTFTVSFDNIQTYGNNYATITVDPWGETNDTNRNNNSVSTIVYRY
jgi:hypothetical protein